MYLFIIRLKHSAALVVCFSYIIAWCIKPTLVVYISPKDYNENSLPTKTTVLYIFPRDYNENSLLTKTTKTTKGKLPHIYSLLG